MSCYENYKVGLNNYVGPLHGAIQNIATASPKAVPDILQEIITKFLRFKPEQRESSGFTVMQHLESDNTVITCGLQLTKQII